MPKRNYAKGSMFQKIAQTQAVKKDNAFTIELPLPEMVLIIFISCCSLYSCSLKKTEYQEQKLKKIDILEGENLALTYCQSCHLFPEPGQLDKKTWQYSVLPAMGHRLGMYGEENTPPDSLFEPGIGGIIVKEAGIYPDSALIAAADWQKIQDYYTEIAPDSLSKADKTPLKQGLKNFKVRIPKERFDPPQTILVHIRSSSGNIYIADAGNKYIAVLDQNINLMQHINIRSKPADLRFSPEGLYVTIMGNLRPSDYNSGELLYYQWDAAKSSYVYQKVLLEKLHRPVHTSFADLDGDGDEDIVMCNFGNLVGDLSWYERKEDGQLQPHLLRSLPGAIRTYIHDFNQDQLPDIIALMAQGDEGVFIYYNQGRGKFREEAVLRFDPAFGSTYLELADFNGDGYLDILYTNGDNADYSPILKPYHGVRVFLNDGNNHFAETYFYPLHGAYKAIVRDFDHDNDLDIAAISFFPDFDHAPKESFVYLENQGDDSFEASTFKESAIGRWITFDTGDIDQDGDSDIVLGAFSILAPITQNKQLQKNWQEIGPSIVILENTTFQ